MKIMKLADFGIYHIYNQGNNRRDLFYKDADYEKFLALFKDKVLSYCDVMAWCLMPNHFHFLVTPNETGLEEIKTGNITSTKIGNGFRILQSQYAQYLNMQQGNSGSVFRQKAKFSDTKDGSPSYPNTCFHYIHQNPLRAHLVAGIGDWKFSSYNEYDIENETGICNQQLAFQLLGIKQSTFREDSMIMLSEEDLNLVRPVISNR